MKVQDIDRVVKIGKEIKKLDDLITELGKTTMYRMFIKKTDYGMFSWISLGGNEYETEIEVPKSLWPHLIEKASEKKQELGKELSGLWKTTY